MHALICFRFPPQKRRHKRTLFVCTIEKAHALFNSLLVEQRLLDEVGLIVIDEIHMLGEPTRGAHLECLVTKVKHINSTTIGSHSPPELKNSRTDLTNSRIQLIAMSATVGNLHELARFLDHAELFTDAWRPVQLEEYVKVDSVVDPDSEGSEICWIWIRNIPFHIRIRWKVCGLSCTPAKLIF
jgi:POLQ-like helicase